MDCLTLNPAAPCQPKELPNTLHAGMRPSELRSEGIIVGRAGHTKHAKAFGMRAQCAVAGGMAENLNPTRPK